MGCNRVLKKLLSVRGRVVITQGKVDLLFLWANGKTVNRIVLTIVFFYWIEVASN